MHFISSWLNLSLRFILLLPCVFVNTQKSIFLMFQKPKTSPVLAGTPGTGSSSFLCVTLSLCPSICHENLTFLLLVHFLIFLHKTFKLYCFWQNRHTDACSLSQGHVFARVLAPFSLTLYSDKASEGETRD